MKTVNWRLFTLVCVMLVATGCGSGLAGTYKADARLAPGKTETGEPGYTLEEIRIIVEPAHSNSPQATA